MAWNRHKIGLRLLWWLLLIAGAILVGFLLTSHGAFNWDDRLDYEHSKYLLASFGMGPPQTSPIPYFGTITDLILGIGTEYVFPWIHDPLWVRHALICAGYLLFIILTFVLLKKNGIPAPTALLCCVLIFSFIRLGGHAMVNQKDPPAAYLCTLALLFLPIAFKKGMQSSRIPIGWILSSSAFSTLVFLARVPLLLPFLCCSAGWALVAVRRKHRSNTTTFFCLILPAAIFILLTYLLTPIAWQEGWIRTFTHSITYYSRHNFAGTFTIFGYHFQAPLSMPWWYPFVWIPVGFDPMGLPFLVIGLFFAARCAFSLKSMSKARKEHLLLSRWMWIVVILALGALIIIKPHLYDEERHLLFLYPILGILGGLGWAHTKHSSQYALAGIIAGSSIFSYATWQEYSLYFKNPILTVVSSSRFNDDYWGICHAKTLRALPRFIQNGDVVLMRTPMDIVGMERPTTTRLPRWPGFDASLFIHSNFIMPVNVHFGLFLAKRSQLGTIVPGRVIPVLWQDWLPTGEITCAIGRYPQDGSPAGR